jgi:hypothetical protein
MSGDQITAIEHRSLATHRRRVRRALHGLAGLVVLAFTVSARATVTVTDSTGWNAWYNQQGSYVADPGGDQQTGQGTDDFIGNATTAAFQQKAGYLASDPTTQYVLFRARMGKYETGSKGFGSGNGSNVSLGLDLTGNGGLNLIMDLNVKGNNVVLKFAAPGTGANDAPSTTSWGNFAGDITLNSDTYNYDQVTDGITLNSSGTAAAGTENGSKATSYGSNAWVTFAISYANLEAAIRAYAANGSFAGFQVNDFTAISFVAFTSTQGNAINQDLLGTEGNMNSATTFASLGAGTPLIRPGGGNIPEPAAALQLGAVLAIGFFGGRRRRGVRARRPVDGWR